MDTERFSGPFGCLVVLLVVMLGLVYLWIGAAGINHQFGGRILTLSILAIAFFRFTLPFTIGTYFGIFDVIGWPEWAGLLIAVPSLIFIIPGLIYGIYAIIYAIIMERMR